MSICTLWDQETGCRNCVHNEACRDAGVGPGDMATALEINALVDADVLPESYRREVYAIAQAVDFAETNDGKCRITLELERDDGVWYEIEEGDKMKITMFQKVETKGT